MVSLLDNKQKSKQFLKTITVMCKKTLNENMPFLTFWWDHPCLKLLIIGNMESIKLLFLCTANSITSGSIYNIFQELMARGTLNI